MRRIEEVVKQNEERTKLNHYMILILTACNFLTMVTILILLSKVT